MAKIESTYGTDASPVYTADGIAVRNVTKRDPEISMLDKMRVRPNRASQGKDVGSIYQAWEVEMDAQGPAGYGGVDMPVPKIDVLLRACEMTRADVGAAPITGYLYSFRSREAQTSLTVVLEEFELDGADARTIKSVGTKFSWEFSIGVDEPAIFKFTGLGLMPSGADTDTAYTASDLRTLLDYGNAQEVCDAANGKAVTLTLGGVTRQAKSVKIKINRKAEMAQSVTGTYGNAFAYNTADEGSVFEVEIDPFEELVADYNQWTNLLSQGTSALVIAFTTAQGCTYTFTCATTQEGEFTRDNDKNLVRISQKLYPSDCHVNGADSALTLQIDGNP